MNWNRIAVLTTGILLLSQILPAQMRVSHRGGGKLAPENTLSGVKVGLSLGADALEVDVHQTKDSVVVVMHDETVDRTTNGTGRIEDLSYAEIKAMDAGSWFSEDFAGEIAPTLEEVLNEIAGKSTLFIEIKGGKTDYPGLEQRIVDMVHAHNALEWVQIISFDRKALERVHEIDPRIRLQYLIVAPLRGLPIYLDYSLRAGRVWKCDFVWGIGIYTKTISKGFVKRAHKRGLKVNVWTVNEVDRVEELREMGVDAITSDRCDLWK